MLIAADLTSIIDDKSCGISIIGKVSIILEEKRGERNRSFQNSLAALTIYESRYKFLSFSRRLMSKRGKERKETADVVVEKKKLTKLIAVFAVNGNGDHLLAVKFRAVSLSLSIPDSS